jgi:hypothetical protein
MAKICAYEGTQSLSHDRIRALQLLWVSTRPWLRGAVQPIALEQVGLLSAAVSIGASELVDGKRKVG